MCALWKLTVLTVLAACLPAVAGAADRDGDGVDDSVDVCPNTPPGVLVDAQGRPRGDLDGDCDVDLDDFELFQASYTGPMYPPEICNDGLDNDLDGLTDCADVDDCPLGAGCGAHAACGAAASCECDSGWADCDDWPGNGCETDLQTSPEHCGDCGVACTPGPNVTATSCVNGECVIAACASGYRDCNGLYTDGCEVNTNTSTQNCGACGVVCHPGPNVVAVACVNGNCRIAACAPGYADCDYNYTNGCEVSIATDVHNCGLCGRICGSVPNATSVGCVNGECRVLACAPGYADCDLVYSNGCEVNTNTSLTHCGSCGHACTPPPHVATTSCTAGQCVIETCASGWADCNGQYADGCEVSLDNSPACAGATSLPNVSGDQSCMPFGSASGRGEAWYRVWVMETDTSPLVGHTLYFDAMLQNPSGMDYDLYLYDGCNGNLLDSSTQGAGQPEDVGFTWSDNLASLDHREFWIEIRYYGGSACGTWYLGTYGGCSP